MLNRSFSDTHHFRRVAQPVLHFLQYCFMLPASNPPFRARCALRFHCATPAFRTPVAVQRQAFFNVGIAPDQRLSSRANVFVFCRVIDEGIVIETPVGLGSRGPGERLTTTVCLLRRWALPDCATCRWLMFTLTRYCCRCVPVPCTLIPGKPAGLPRHR